MQLILSNGEPLRGDLTLVVIKRTDLTAIPSTLECLIRVDEDLAQFIQPGKTISLANKKVKYHILAIDKKADGLRPQGNPNYQLTKVIAILDNCREIAFAKQKAIIKENTSFSAIYHGCGAEINVTQDVKVDKFACYVGDAPSFSIQIALQRCASVPVWDGENSLSFHRLRDLFNQSPVEILDTDITQDFTSQFIERHEIPAFYSNKQDGNLVKTEHAKGKAADFEMFADSQVLNNLATYLVQRKQWTTRLMPHINAGQIIAVAGKKYVIITATHIFSQAESGSGSHYSRFWLGELSTM